MPTTPYWLDDAAPVPRGRRLRGRPDVVVIGGGVTGCACALRLAEGGARVRLHEAQRVGAGASGRNGGFALRGLALPYDEAVGVFGRSRARELVSLTEEGLRVLASLAGDAFRGVGSLRLAADDAEADSLRRELDALVADGFVAAWVDQLEPPLDRLYRAAIVHPGDGALHPARWNRRLAARAAEAGVEIRERAPLDPASARSDADAVVVATDGYTAAAVPALAGVIAPTRGQVLATGPVPDVRYPRPHYARHGLDYWQQLPDGTLVVGGCRDAGGDAEATDVEETTPAVQSRLDDLARALARPDVRVTHRWAGLWGTTPDRLPLVGRLPSQERTWIAAGYSGHGNVLGLVCGRLVADALLGRDDGLPAEFDPARFGAGVGTRERRP